MNLTPEQKREASAMLEGNRGEMMPEFFKKLVWLKARVAELKEWNEEITERLKEWAHRELDWIKDCELTAKS